MKESFWTGNGKNAWTTKVVVSCTGHAVAKNYQTDDIRFGDLGLTMRLDRKLDGMTTEQRLAAQDLAQAMFTDLMRMLGKEVIEGSGIPVGSFIEHDDQVYRVAKETKLGLHLEPLNEGFLGATEFHGWASLSEVVIIPSKPEHTIVRSFLDSHDRPLKVYRDFLQTWGEDMLCGAFILDKGSWKLDEAREFLSLIQDNDSLIGIHQMAKNRVLCNVAMLIALERTEAQAATPDP